MSFFKNNKKAIQIKFDSVVLEVMPSLLETCFENVEKS